MTEGKQEQRQLQKQVQIARRGMTNEKGKNENNCKTTADSLGGMTERKAKADPSLCAG
jgi:hypothetical protein